MSEGIEQSESENIAVAVWRDRLGFCECGRPKAALAKMRDALRAIKAVSDMHRSDVSCYPNGKATPEMQALLDAEESASGADDGARYVMYYLLDRAGLTEHGGSVPGWPTEDGEEFLKFLDQTDPDDWMREADDPTDEDMQAWRENNHRLMVEGWSLGTSFGMDGAVEHYATRGDERISNNPTKTTASTDRGE